MNAPTITIIQDFETDLFHLMATSYSTTEPCGPRLFRGGELPAIQFVHADEMEALRDAEMLQRYCDLAWQGKAPKAKGREEKEETVPVADLSGAWWNE